MCVRACARGGVGGTAVSQVYVLRAWSNNKQTDENLIDSPQQCPHTSKQKFPCAQNWTKCMVQFQVLTARGMTILEDEECSPSRHERKKKKKEIKSYEWAHAN